MSPVAGLTDPTTTPVRPVAPSAGESIIAFEERDACPGCEAPLATDQRYCLTCGHRRGDPRLPFLDAATSTDSAGARGGTGRTPPPPPSRQGSKGWSPNASLIVAVAAVILAVGLGFLIGRAVHEAGSAANHGTERITIEATESKHPSEPESLLEVEEETARQITEEQLHAKVPLPNPTAKIGESCTQGTPGCGKSKKFNGVFFGAEE